MNLKCTLEMLQSELWLVVSMRKCGGLFHPASSSMQTHSLIFFFPSLLMHLFVCLAFLFQNPISHLLQFSLLVESGNQSNASRSVIIGCFSVHAGKWLDCV